MAPRRVILVSIAVIVAIVLVVVVVSATRSSPSRHKVAGSVKEVEIAKLPRLDAVVVLPADATSADAGGVRVILDHTAAVERYAPLPTSTLALVLRFGGTASAKLRSRVCAAPSTRSYAVEMDRAVHDPLRALIAEVGDRATVPSIFKRSVGDVEIFMKVNATAAQVAAVHARIARDPDVTKSTFIDHQNALREFKKLFASEPVLIENTKASSLPESFRLQVRDGVSLSTVAQQFQGLPGVDQANARSNELWAHVEPDAPSGQVEVFMRVRASGDEIAAVKASLTDDAAVESFRFLSKEDAYNEFKLLFGDEPKLIEGTNPSALPTSFRVTLENPDGAPDFEQRYKRLPGVEYIRISRGALVDACAPSP